MSADDHGSASTYNNHNCRCDACRGAWREYQRKYQIAARRRRGVRPMAQYLAEVWVGHGHRTRYQKGCRCDECRKAEAAYRAEYRARQRATR